MSATPQLDLSEKQIYNLIRSGEARATNIFNNHSESVFHTELIIDGQRKAITHPRPLRFSLNANGEPVFL